MEENGAQRIKLPSTPARPGLAGRLEHLDHRVFRFCYETTKNPLFDAIMPLLSNAANRGLLQIATSTILITAGLALKEERFCRAAYCLLAATGLSGLIAETVIKAFWKRKRPFDKLEGVERRVKDRRLLRRPSFPSGHAAGYMAAGVALAVFFPQGAPAFVIVALLGGYSRTYNGVHFPSDVAAGLLLGAACGAVVAEYLPRILP